jgi:hypothetical protein
MNLGILVVSLSYLVHSHKTELENPRSAAHQAEQMRPVDPALEVVMDVYVSQTRLPNMYMDSVVGILYTCAYVRARVWTNWHPNPAYPSTPLSAHSVSTYQVVFDPGDSS